MTKEIIIGTIFFFLIPTSIIALMPPEDIIKRNLEAEYIVIGEVVERGEVLLKTYKTSKDNDKTLDTFFVVEVSHIVKASESIKQKDRIKVLYERPSKAPPGIDAMVTGSIPIKAEIGNIVIVYSNPDLYNSGYYRPLAGGSSVITIGRPNTP